MDATNDFALPKRIALSLHNNQIINNLTLATLSIRPSVADTKRSLAWNSSSKADSLHGMTQKAAAGIKESGISLVAGGSGGIGTAIVRRLVRGGKKVAFTFQQSDPSALVEEMGNKATAHRIDLQDPQACRKLADDLIAQHGAIENFIHAAGPHVPMVHLSKVSPENFADQVNADLVGFFNIIHAVLPSLRTTSGSITAVTSAATARYPKRDGLSAIPKGGVETMIRALAAEEGRYGVRANSVAPGMLSDGMAARLIDTGELDSNALQVTMDNIPLRRFGTAADIAEAVAFLVSEKANFISGQKLNVDGGYSV
ncbi:SDR family NAD(P)-dependent oxidoreductase [Glutamicibacter soli]|nr:SDR family oxidoreductase [Glutamicibacter soli]